MSAAGVTAETATTRVTVERTGARRWLGAGWTMTTGTATCSGSLAGAAGVDATGGETSNDEGPGALVATEIVIDCWPAAWPAVAPATGVAPAEVVVVGAEVAAAGVGSCGAVAEPPAVGPAVSVVPVVLGSVELAVEPQLVSPAPVAPLVAAGSVAAVAVVPSVDAQPVAESVGGGRAGARIGRRRVARRRCRRVGASSRAPEVSVDVGSAVGAGVVSVGVVVVVSRAGAHGRRRARVGRSRIRRDADADQHGEDDGEARRETTFKWAQLEPPGHRILLSTSPHGCRSLPNNRKSPFSESLSPCSNEAPAREYTSDSQTNKPQNTSLPARAKRVHYWGGRTSRAGLLASGYRHGGRQVDAFEGPSRSTGRGRRCNRRRARARARGSRRRPCRRCLDRLDRRRARRGRRGPARELPGDGRSRGHLRLQGLVLDERRAHRLLRRARR